jgi:predicted  nucleic acid-binding Zn-ribbon protein
VTHINKDIHEPFVDEPWNIASRHEIVGEQLNQLYSRFESDEKSAWDQILMLETDLKTCRIEIEDLKNDMSKEKDKSVKEDYKKQLDRSKNRRDDLKERISEFKRQNRGMLAKVKLFRKEKEMEKDL